MTLYKKYSAFFIYIVFPFIMGCSGDDPIHPLISTVRIEGKVNKSSSYTEIFNQNTAAQNVAVDIYRLSNSGNVNKVNVNSAVSNSDGRFLIETELEANREYLLVAHKDEKVWKAVVNTPVENEVTIFIQPLTGESTAEAEVYIAAKNKAYNISYYDISLIVNGSVAEIIEQDPPYAREVADIINNAVDGRLMAFNSGYFGGNNERFSHYYKEADIIKSKFARDLHFAPSGSAVRTLVDQYYESYTNAFLNTGLSTEKITELLQVYYRLLVSNSTDIEFIRSVSLMKANILDYSLSADLRRLNGGRKVSELNTAADILIAAINKADTYPKIKEAFNIYKNTVLNSLYKVAGLSFALKNIIEQRILPGINKLKSNIEYSNDKIIIVNAYVEYFSNVYAEVNSLLKNTYSDDADLITGIMLMLYVKI